MFSEELRQVLLRIRQMRVVSFYPEYPNMDKGSVKFEKETSKGRLYAVIEKTLFPKPRFLVCVWFGGAVNLIFSRIYCEEDREEFQYFDSYFEHITRQKIANDTAFSRAQRERGRKEAEENLRKFLKGEFD